MFDFGEDRGLYTCYMEDNSKVIAEAVEEALIETPPQYHLTKKNKLFCQYYTDLADMDVYGNATQSALKAGYSECSARKIASELMQKPIIKAELDRIELDRSRQTDFSRADFLKMLVNKARTTRSEAVQVRYLEMIGRCKGYIDPESNSAMNVSLFQSLDGKISNRLQVINTTNVKEAKVLAVNPATLHNVATDNGLVAANLT